MNFGIFNLMNRRHRSQTVPQVIAETLEHIQAAEAAGFGVSWFTEHHFTNYSMAPSPLMMVGHAAPQTTHIKLGTAVVLPALYQPARLLGDIAFADNLADGRLILGLGSGYQAYELRRFGIDLAETSAITDEWIEFLSQGLGQESFEFRGKYIDLPQTWFTVDTVQKPHPQIWIAGNSPGSQLRALKGNHPLIATGFGRDADTLAEIRAGADDTWRAAGHDPNLMRFGSLRYCFVTDHKAEAFAYAENARFQVRLSAFLRQGQTELEAPWLPEVAFADEMTPEDILRWNPIGDPETVAERLVEEIQKVGSDHIALYMSIGDSDHGAVMRSIRRFGDEVIPLIEKSVGPLAGAGRFESAMAAK
ncbi:MAG: LLM class flavin-dependent oxidoreductase [Alphaproteobacteria bacterium]|nr:LLM class flavin-dependent oxidoreductase [Alphaproteobacteria bacterium]HCP00574.1 LLM class flavin-dependent oxidoreductase [Rhodospirillaceae bacterium]